VSLPEATFHRYTSAVWREVSSLASFYTPTPTGKRLLRLVTNAKYAQPTLTRLNSTVESRRRRRCVLGLMLSHSAVLEPLIICWPNLQKFATRAKFLTKKLQFSEKCCIQHRSSGSLEGLLLQTSRLPFPSRTCEFFMVKESVYNFQLYKPVGDVISPLLCAVAPPGESLNAKRPI